MAIQLTPTFIGNINSARNLNLGTNAQLISRLLYNKGSQLNHLTLKVLPNDLWGINDAGLLAYIVNKCENALLTLQENIT